MEKFEEEKNLQKKLEESNEPSWELMRYCLGFLEENSQDWAKRKRLREQEQQRQERLEKAKRKQRKTQMNMIEKKIRARVIKKNERAVNSLNK